MRKRTRWKSGVVLVGLLCVVWNAPAVEAITTILTDGNSSVVIDPFSQAGMSDWVVDGVDHLSKQWFWFRKGSGGGESSLDSLSLPAPFVTPLGPRIVEILYTGVGFTVDITYILTGGTAGSGTSDIAESIRIRNTSGSTLDFHFFQYSDFDLNGTASGDTVQFLNPNTVRQTDGGTIQETVSIPTASHHDAALFAVTLSLLNDSLTTTLSDANGPLTGDVTYTWQWDLTLAPGGTFLISKDKHLVASAEAFTIVPEPGTLLLLGSGLVALGAGGWLRRRRK